MAFIPNSLCKRAEEQVVEEQLLGIVFVSCSCSHGGKFY